MVATRSLRERGRLRRVLVVDLDVHQGDGTNAALADDDEAFTCALNGLGNYPFDRVPGDLERDLPGGTGDDAYLDALAALLPEAIQRARRALLLPRRRRRVRGRSPGAPRAHARGPGRPRPPRALLAPARRHPRLRDAGGGYAERIEDTVAINLATLRAFA